MALLAAALAGAAPAAAAPAIRVDVQACAGVDAREVERLLAIELETLAPTGSIDVGLTCAGPRLRMTARDPVLGRALVRDVELGPPDPGRDRTIALLVSQLFLTSWAEEFLEHPVPHAPPVGPVTVTPQRPVPRPASWDVQLAAGTRLRDWDAPALAGTVSVTGRRRVGPVQVLALAAFEHGAADRAAGSAVWNLGELGAGLGWRSAEHHRVAVSAALTGSAALAQVRGDAASAAYAGSSVGGALGQVALTAGPCLVRPRWRAGLDLELGATWPRATARIAGDRALALGGPWTGARVWIGWGHP